MATRYVWEKFDVVGTESHFNSGMGTSGFSIEIPDVNKIYAYTGTMRYDTTQDEVLGSTLLGIYNYPTNEIPLNQNGTVYIVFETKYERNKYCYYWQNLTQSAGKHFRIEELYGETIIIGYIDDEWPDVNPGGMVKTQFIFSKGSISQGKSSSASLNAYSEGKHGGFWYVSLGSDTIDPSAVTYDASTVIAGDTVTVVISPSAGNIYGGTITYIIETNTDEAGWEPYMETTSTSFTFTIPEEAVSWRCRVKAKDNTGFTSDTYVYGNNAITTPTTVIYPSIFAVIPEDKSLGFVASPQVLSYLVTTDEGVNYQITATVNGSIVKTATESPQARILELPEEVWEELSDTQVHELKLTVTQGDQQIIRTFQFRKFSYSYDTLYGLFTGIAQATRIKRGISRNLVGADFPKEILKITSLKDIAEPSYIDVVLPYVQGGTVVVSSSEGDIYESLLDESGTTRVTVYHTGIYSVQGYAGNSPSSSGSVTIAEDGDIETVTLQWIKLTVTVLAGAEVTATQSNRAVSGTAGENGTVDLILPGTGAWSLTASHEDYSFAATGVVAVSGYGNYTVTLDFVSTVFGENSWATIQRIVKAGKAASYWNVGDSKAVVLNGSVGG